MFTPSRDEVRRFFFETWRKHSIGETLAGLEHTALAVLTLHPEYHRLLDDTGRNLERDYPPETGEVNPFLHLSLHLALEEQISIDQPPGVRAEFERLRGKLGSEHDALHAMLECLGETLWQAQREGAAPEQTSYLDCIRRK